MNRTSPALAHSANDAGCEQPLALHLQEVAEMAARFAESYASDEAKLAGYLHDAGKYGELFRKRLRGEVRNIDHWSPGAWLALTQYRNVAVALAIQGHHTGLQRLDGDSLRELNPESWDARHPHGPRLSTDGVRDLNGCLQEDGIKPAKPACVLYGERCQKTASAMLDVRMLFSALVDADFLDTERHFNNGAGRVPGRGLQPEQALELVTRHICQLERCSAAAGSVRSMRRDLFQACVSAAKSEQGVFTLTAPTGTGKTLAALAFGLQHALTTGARRLVFVIPYLSIIEQTARVYRQLLEPYFGQGYVLEHHSLTGIRPASGTIADGCRDAEDEGERRRRELAENWDAPLVVTTSVQFLESLFANRPGACRKLHSLAESVVIFDEVQTLPLGLVIPALQTLSRLHSGYRCSIVFSTATQPAFASLDRHVKEDRNCGWKPREIVSPDLNLFNRARRTQVVWPGAGDVVTSWDELVELLAREDQVLCVLNLKRHALRVAQMLRDRGVVGVRHLSTNLCPAHRQKVLEAVETGAKPCRLVSTQCVEAGVDLDFPVLYRAIGPLEAIAQAAGRCNRNGNRDEGRVVVFVPEDDRYPPGGYEQAAAVTRLLLRKRGSEGMDIYDPKLFCDYYTELYNIAKPDTHNAALIDAIRRQDFGRVAEEFRVIDTDTINVLVPYDIAVSEPLADEVRTKGVTRDWQHRARPYTVNVFRPKESDPIRRYLEPAPLAGGVYSEEWFIYLRPKHYDADNDLGLVVPQEPEVLTA